MFGIAIWDGARRRAVLARDRLGVKPLYRARVGDLVVFGSELKSMLASGLVEPDLDYEAIDAYLASGSSPGRARRSPASPSSCRGTGSWSTRTAWRSSATGSTPGRTRAPACAWTRPPRACSTQLDESVRLRLMADVPWVRC